MKIGDRIGCIISSIANGLNRIGSFLTRKPVFGFIMVLLILGGIVYCTPIGFQRWHAKKVSDARQQYDINGLDDTHFLARKNYLYANYETSLSGFTEFLNKFPSVLYTADSLDSDAERSNKVDEAIIKVVLSVRKLNKNDELSYYVRFFKNKFPKSKLAVNFNSDQASILDWYQSGVFSLYDMRRHLLEMEEMVEGSQSLPPIQKWRWTEELSESTRKSFETARKVFENLLSNEHLNKMPYSALRVEALYFIAKSFLIEGNYTRAYQEFDKIATAEFGNYPDLQDDAMYYAAYCLKERSIYDEAFGRYTEFMSRFPNSEYVTDAYFDLGEIYAFRKEYDSARDSYESALKRAKDQSRKVELQLADAHTDYKIGNDKRANNKGNEAQVEYEKAIRIYRELSTEYLEDSFLTEALDFISEFPKKSSDWNKDIEGKINAYERFVRKHGQNREAKFRAAIGRAYYDEGIDNSELGNDLKSRDSYETAITVYKLLLDEYLESDHSPHTKLLIANIYNILDEHSDSIKAYERIINEYEDDYGKKEVLIDITMNAAPKEISEIKIYGSPKETDSRVFSAYEIGEAYFQMRDFEKALEWYRKITDENGFKYNDSSDALDFRRDPLAPDALYGAMQVLHELGREDELEKFANTYIEDIREVNPFLSAEAQLNFAHIKRKQAELKIKLKQPEKAATLYNSAAWEYMGLNEKFEIENNSKIRDYPSHPNPRYNLIKLYGRYYEDLCYEEYGKQHEKLAKQIEANSDHFSVKESEDLEDLTTKTIATLSSAGQFLLSMGRGYREATTLFKTVFQPLIDIPNIDVPHRDHYITEATRVFKELVLRYPNDENSAYWQYLSGEFYFAQKDFENAIAEYEKVLKIYPTSDYVKDASDRIEEIRQELGNKIGRQMGYSDESGNSKSLRQAQAEKQLTPEEIAQKASDSTVFLDMKDAGSGSGFFVDSGLIATNFHVIAGATDGQAYLVSKNLTYAIVGVVAADEGRDLAILKVKAFGVPSLPRASSDNVKVGETVYAAGSPKGWKDTVSMGIISRVRPVFTNIFRSGQVVTAKRIQITAPTSPGSSGGPLLNSKGEVIGINHAGNHSPDAQNLNLAISVSHLEKLIKRVGTPEPLKNFKITAR